MRQARRVFMTMLLFIAILFVAFCGLCLYFNDLSSIFRNQGLIKTARP